MMDIAPVFPLPPNPLPQGEGENFAMPVNLEIVSPEKLLLSRPVDMVVIPASEGDMGVLEGHAPAIVMLRGGVIALYEGERSPTRCTSPAALPK